MFEKLTDVFITAAEKYLTVVDAEPNRSNQHEVGGLKEAGFADFLGYPVNGEKWYLPVTMVYITDDDNDPVICEDTMSWYDTRYNQPSRSAEYRLYYRSNEVTRSMRAGDFFIIAMTKDKTLLTVCTPAGGQAESQLRTIFGSAKEGKETSLKPLPVDESLVVAPIRLMLAELGIEFYVQSDSDKVLLEHLIEKFDSKFPATKKFSDFSRKIIKEKVSEIEDPDNALLTWMGNEEKLFRILERHIVSEKLKEGFGKSGNDVDEFIRFSLSVQNRRKSRVGHAFENHITEILLKNKVSFEKGVYTEGKQKPDFLFPSRSAYLDLDFDTGKLHILAAKTTCKERWRQVLTEGDRIKNKHLITLEPAISRDQIEQMVGMNVQLVVPAALHQTYLPEQQCALLTFKNFIKVVK